MHTQTFINLIETENARNKAGAAIFSRFIRHATGCPDTQIVIGHHITFIATTQYGDDNTVEISSADTLWMNRPLMERVFGAKAIPLMVQLAGMPTEYREAAVSQAMDACFGPESMPSGFEWHADAQSILEGNY